MNCQQFDHWIADFDPFGNSHALPPEPGAHAENCPGCRMKLNRLQGAIRELTNPAFPELNPFFSTRVLAAISEKESPKPGFFHPAYRLVRISSFSIVLGLGLAFGIHMGRTLLEVLPDQFSQDQEIQTFYKQFYMDDANSYTDLLDWNFVLND